MTLHDVRAAYTDERPRPCAAASPLSTALAAGLAWQRAGCSVVPVKEDGSKEPALSEWTSRKATAASEAEVRGWFEHGHSGLGIVCGEVSGNLEMFELEGRAVHEGLRDRVRALVPTELWQRFGTYVERTPSGGLHMLVRVEGIAVPGNLRLARRPSTEQERDTWRAKEHRKAAVLPEPQRSKRMTYLENLTCEQVPQVLAETRGEGGFVVVAPSGGKVHGTGRPWAALHSSRPGAVGTITTDERDLLLEAFRSLDQMPAPKPAAPRSPAPSSSTRDTRPGDAWAAATTWHDVLQPHGWTMEYERGGEVYWTRPGKSFGTSATTNYAGSDLLQVFTTSTEFEPERTFTKFGAYAVLEHDGDHAAAAAQLRRDGHGGSAQAPLTSAQRLAAAEPPQPPGCDWERPLPLGPDPVPPFPVEHLPTTLRDFVAAVARSTQTPADLAGLMSLLALATAAAGKYRVHLREDWTEPLNLYGLVALPPGSRKSSVFKSAVAPLVQAEKEMLDRAGPLIRAAQQRHRILEQAAKKAETAAVAKSGDPSKLAEAEAADLALWGHTVPPTPRLLADDVTPEQLVTLLADHTCLGLLSEEGGIFETLAGRYSGGVANLDAVLKAWDGGSIRVDRRGSEPRQVEDPALTLGLAVQPAVLTALSRSGDLTGRGLLARFLYAVPDLHSGAVRVGGRDLDPPPVPPEVADRYGALLSRLALQPRPDRPAPLHLDAAARAAFQAFRADLEPRRDADTGDLADVVDWSGKLEGLTARLAGLLHLARNGTVGTITVDDIAGAVALARYAIPHAKAAHALMVGRTGQNAAASLLRVLEAKALQEFSVRDLHRLVSGQTRFEQVTEVETALVVLVERGHVRAVEMPKREGPGRPPSPRYVVNPHVLAQS